MDVNILVAIFQAAIAAIVGYVVYLGRRDAKRAIQVSLLSWLEGHRRETANYIVNLSLVPANKNRDAILKNDEENARQRLEILQHVSLKILKEMDRELQLNGELTKAFKQELQQAGNER